jgi:hypothetical protein
MQCALGVLQFLRMIELAIKDMLDFFMQTTIDCFEGKGL